MRKFSLIGKKAACAVAVAVMVMGSMTACGSSKDTGAAQESDVIVENAETSESTAEDKMPENQEKPDMDKQEMPGQMSENSYMGSITAIDGNTITVSVMGGGMRGGNMGDGQMPEGMDQGQMPEGMNQGEMPEMPSGEMPEGMGQGEMPEMPSGEMPEGMSQGEMPEMPSGEMTEGMGQGEMPEMPSGEMPEGMDFGNMEAQEMTITVSDTTVITVNGEAGTVSDLQVGDSIMFELDGETVVSITVGMMK